MKKKFAILLCVIALVCAACQSSLLALPPKPDGNAFELNSSAPPQNTYRSDVPDEPREPIDREENTPAQLEKQPAPITPTPSDTEIQKPSEPLKTPGMEFSKDKVYVLFTFDDGCKSDYELVYPLFKSLGIRGTSFIIGKLADEKDKTVMNWDQIKEMYEYGWDFECHTYEHSNLQLLTKEQRRQSMQLEDETFIKHGLPKPQIIAFPFGKYDQSVIDDIKDYRKLMRKAYYDDKDLPFEKLNQYELDSVSADFRKEKRYEGRKKLVDKAIAENAVLILRTHMTYADKPDKKSKWIVQTDFNLYAQLVKYICAKPNVEVITMSQLLQMMENANMLE